MRPRDGAAPVAVVTALREELAPILSRVRGVRRLPRPGARFFRGRLGSVDAILTATGDGPLCAGRGADALLAEFRPAALYGAGIAGALSPSLSAGDLLLSRHVRDREGETPPPDGVLLARALAISGAVAGTLVTVDRLLPSAAAKARLAESLPAGAPAAVDMESAGWGRAAAARGVAYLVVRAISDEARDELPAFLPRCVGPDGRLRRPEIVVRALAHPASIPVLLKMRRQLLEGSRRLADFLARLFGEEA